MKLRFMGVEIDVTDEQAERILGQFFRGHPSLISQAVDRVRRGDKIYIVGMGAWQPTAPCLVGRVAIVELP